MVNQPHTDGRKARGQENRRLIVEALMQLTHEGVISPTAEMVSERAGVGLRTVFRHFEDMETLYREVSLQAQLVAAPVLAKPVQGDTVQDKLKHAIERRTGVFEQLMPVFVSNRAHQHESPFLREQHATTVALQRMLLEQFLPKELVRDETLFEALDLALSVETWMRLRRDQNLSVTKAKAVMLRTVLALVGSVGQKESGSTRPKRRSSSSKP